MSTRATILLVALFCGLAALYWWGGQRVEEAVERVAESSRIFDSPEDAITSIGIERAGEELVEASRSGEAWTINQPHSHILASTAAWDRLASTLSAMTNARTIDSKMEDPSIYGLDSPPLRVFVGVGGSIEQIDFGRLDPTQAFRYARTAAKGLFLTPATIFEDLNKSLIDLRDRSVFRTPEGGFSRLAYHAAANAGRPDPIDMEFERTELGEWRMTKPFDAIASREKLDALAAEMQLMQGRRYIDLPENLSDYGLAKPFAQLTAINSGGAPQTLNLGWIDDSEESAGLFAQREGETPVFVVDAGIVTQLPESVDSLRESHLFTREANRLTAFTYRDAQKTMRLEIDDAGAWKLVEPPADDTDQLAVSAYIAILKQLEAASYPDSSVESNARITLGFEYADGQPASQIRIGGPVPDTEPAELYAWSDNGTLMTLPFQAWILLNAEPFKFRDKRIFRFDSRDAEAVELTLEGVHYRFDFQEDRWRVVSPEGYFFESQDDAQGVLDALSGFKGLAIVTPHGGNEIHGVDSPMLEAEVWTRAESGAQESAGHIYVGNIATDQGRHRFARSASREDILLVDQALVDDLRAALEGVVPR